MPVSHCSLCIQVIVFLCLFTALKILNSHDPSLFLSHSHVRDYLSRSTDRLSPPRPCRLSYRPIGFVSRLFPLLYFFATRHCRRWHYVFCPLHSSGQILLPRYLMLEQSRWNVHRVCREYSLAAATCDVIRFWRSKVNVTAGRREVKVAKACTWTIVVGLMR